MRVRFVRSLIATGLSMCRAVSSILDDTWARFRAHSHAARPSASLGLACTIVAIGCAGASQDSELGELEQPFTSDVATLLDFEFDAELSTTSIANTRSQIKAQLLYTVGHLNAESGVGRLERVTLTNIVTASLGGGLYRIRYHAKLPVAWGHKTNLPTSYAFSLPRRIDSSGQATFTTRYGQVCNDGDDASVNAGNYWYHFRPRASGCSFAAADIASFTATVRPSSQNSSASYPEYHKVWEDGALTVLAVFGKYTEYATSPSDAGITAYNAFVSDMRSAFPDARVATPTTTGFTETSFTREQDGASLRVVAMLIDGVRVAPASFDKRYSELSPNADLILYNGHAGLGANVRALATKGRFVPGKYQIFFFNGCDTLAYLDDTLATTRAALNPDDVAGTKYMDTVANAMPAYFNDLSADSVGLIRGLMHPDDPDTFARIFAAVDPVQVIVAVGEEDNLFNLSFDPGVDWSGFLRAGEVGHHETLSYETETLEPGTYVFTLSPDYATTGGDADLRVRVGAPPTLTTPYRCKSYLYNSNERCVVKLTSAAKVYMTVTGDTAGQSKFQIAGFEDPRAR